MSQVNVVVVGSINIDLVISTARLPNKGETLIGKELHQIPGGKGANQAVVASRLGANVTMIGCVGDDQYGKDLLEVLKKEKIGTEFVTVLPNVHTGIALITVDQQGDNTIVISQGANQHLTPLCIQKAEKFIKHAQVLLVQLEIPLDTVIETINLAKKHNIPVILNPAPARKLPDTLLKQVDVFTPNETEANIIAGSNQGSTKDLIHSLEEKGIKHVVITLGENGVMYNSVNGIIQLDAFKVDVVDTTAAGDAFNAALGVSIAEGRSLDDAIHFAQKVAALSVTKYGAQPSLPFRTQVDEHIFDH